jgi:hypothetical protein
MLTERGVKARKRSFDSSDIADDRPQKTVSRLREVARKADLPAERGGLPPRIARYLATAANLPSPCLIVDVDMVEQLRRTRPRDSKPRLLRRQPTRRRSRRAPRQAWRELRHGESRRDRPLPQARRGAGAHLVRQHD